MTILIAENFRNEDILIKHFKVLPQWPAVNREDYIVRGFANSNNIVAADAGKIRSLKEYFKLSLNSSAAVFLPQINFVNAKYF